MGDVSRSSDLYQAAFFGAATGGEAAVTVDAAERPASCGMRDNELAVVRDDFDSVDVVLVFGG